MKECLASSLCAVACRLGHQAPESFAGARVGCQNAVEILGRKSAGSVEMEIPNS